MNPGRENDQRAGALLRQRQAKRTGAVHLEKKATGRPYRTFQYLNGARVEPEREFWQGNVVTGQGTAI